jgi:hypothetical protein
MSYREVNIFPVLNLGELTNRYMLYRIRGLSPDHDEYEKNRQHLIRWLSFKFKSPVEIILKNNEPHLVLRDDAPSPPESLDLVRGTVYLDKLEETMTLDYEHMTEETRPICRRFLQFAIEGALYTDKDLWQPGAGKPYFPYTPTKSHEGINIYQGLAVRVVPLSDGGMGICVDVKHKYISQTPLPDKLSRNDFRQYKGANCVYHFGSQWYDIKLHEHSGLTVSEHKFDNKHGKRVTLYQHVFDEARKPWPKEIVNLNENSTALLYRTGDERDMAAVAPLCYLTYETNDARVAKLHRFTILPPHLRRSRIIDFVKRHLSVIKYGNIAIKISDKPIRIAKRHFMPPDLLFGHNSVISVRGSADSSHVSLDELGRSRFSAIFDPDIGTFATKPFEQQYFIWPESVAFSYGNIFLEELKNTVNRLYPSVLPFNPITVAYEDRGAKTFVKLGRAILSAVEKANLKPGYGIVMLHETADRKNRQEDQLASMVMQKLREMGIFVSVIHTEVSSNSYELISKPGRENRYQRVNDRDVAKKLNGYLSNVALVKVLLTNERWPFVLATPLNADMVIGIDVKLHTACFTFVSKNGRKFRTEIRSSNQKEMLGKDKVRTILLEILRQELPHEKIKSIVVHRDGRLYMSEKKGIYETIELLKKENLLDGVSLNFVEISKSSPASVRFFDVDQTSNHRMYINNAQVGSYYCTSAQDAFVSTTGRPFLNQGSANPLHIKYINGSLPLENIIEDIYSLSCLAWTNPRGCTRYPVTTKLTDIRLREHAGAYDEDALQFGEESEVNDDE